MSNSWWDQQFERQGESATFWWLQARRLKRGADLNWEVFEKELIHFKNNPDEFFQKEKESGTINVDFELCRVYYLLLGFAVETLAKGILVGRNPKYFSENRNMTHEIQDYVAECDFDFDEKKRKLLEELSIIVKWKGRYPTPKKLRDWALRKASNGANSPPGTISPNDKQDLEEIYSALHNTLGRENAERATTKDT
jgi:hypothetical protein